MSSGIAWFLFVTAAACSSAERGDIASSSALPAESALSAAPGALAGARPHIARRAKGGDSTTAAGTCSGIKYPANLTPGDGVVLPTAHLVAANWGSGINVRMYDMTSFYSSLSKSEYIGWLSEYGAGHLDYDPHNYTFNPVNTDANVDDGAVQTEIMEQIRSRSLPLPNEDGATIYMVHFPAKITITSGSEVSCSAFCAYHNSGVYHEVGIWRRFEYAVVPDFATACNSGCGEDADWFNNLTSAESHEIVETITDPIGHAWRDRSQCDTNNEIGDLCNQDQAKIHVADTDWIWTVQREWSNRSGACKAADLKTGTLHIGGKCVDLPNDIAANGARVDLYDCTGGPSEKWTFFPDGTIRPAFHTDKCLDNPWGSKNLGNPIDLYDCTGGPSEVWTLAPWGGHARSYEFESIVHRRPQLCNDQRHYS